jgi:hypothetical protein
VATVVREALAKAQRTAVHLEMRDSYMLDDPDFLAWQQGRRLDPTDRDTWWHPWLDVVAEAVGRGVEMRRARIVSEPTSDYIRYEYDGAFTNVAAGEQIRWLPRRRASAIALPGNDFWLFDTELVVLNHFDGNGQWSEPEMEVSTDPELVALCASAFDSVWARAVPHESYRAY